LHPTRFSTRDYPRCGKREYVPAHPTGRRPKGHDAAGLPCHERPYPLARDCSERNCAFRPADFCVPRRRAKSLRPLSVHAFRPCREAGAPVEYATFALVVKENSLAIERQRVTAAAPS
jgi:hypothetical protein